MNPRIIAAPYQGALNLFIFERKYLRPQVKDSAKPTERCRLSTRYPQANGTNVSYFHFKKGFFYYGNNSILRAQSQG
jgi:hypothetical protein